MTSDPRTLPPAAPSADATPPPAYEPPTVAWEEPLETIAATSCGAGNPFDLNCQARPVA